MFLHIGQIEMFPQWSGCGFSMLLVRLKGTVWLQIGSTWEWYHWIGLEKDINHYRFFDFLISLLNIWKDFKLLSRFMQIWIQPPACLDHGLHRILSSFWLAHFYLMKNLPKCCFFLVWIAGVTSCNPKNNWCLSGIFKGTDRRKRLRFEYMQTVIQTSRRLD